ncbi:secreted aspartic proteinase precursor [Nemania sp. FL0031]|nr:secreted aspartic proteinase precursor [Nemania sp. FL0031]
MVPQPSAIALTAALAGLATASPFAQPVPKSFTVPQVANPKFIANGPAQLAKTYRKYGIPLPPGLARTMADYKAAHMLARSTGSVVATPEANDIAYLTTVQIGTPPQALNLDFDSGSSDLWVFSTETFPNEVGNQTLYNPTRSSTAQKVDGATWSIRYGDDSSSSGVVYGDVVSVGGISYPGQAVEVATNVSAQFTRESETDGLLGLAFSKLNTVKPKQAKTWFDNVAEKMLDAPVWTADLKHHAPGTYDFGRIDKSKYTGDITYVPVDTTDGFWTFTMTGWAAANGTYRTSNFTGIADTGTTLGIFPDPAVQEYYNSFKGASMDDTVGGYIFPCNSTPPAFTVGIGGGGKVTIPGSYINYAPLGDSQNHCFGGIQSNGGSGLSIFGDVALKAAFVVFDATVGKERLGFATKKL